jgi:hypothetical protein
MFVRTLTCEMFVIDHPGSGSTRHTIYVASLRDAKAPCAGRDSIDRWTNSLSASLLSIRTRQLRRHSVLRVVRDEKINVSAVNLHGISALIGGGFATLNLSCGKLCIFSLPTTQGYATIIQSIRRLILGPCSPYGGSNGVAFFLFVCPPRQQVWNHRFYLQCLLNSHCNLSAGNRLEPGRGTTCL